MIDQLAIRLMSACYISQSWTWKEWVNMKACQHVVQRTSRQDGPETIGSTEHLTSESIGHKDYIIRTDGYSGT